MEFNEIYQEYGTLVYRFLMSLTQHEQLAEELTQETFYQAIKSADKFKGNSKVSTWLCQIAKHLWFQELAKRKRQEGQSELLDDHDDPSPTPDQILFSSENKVELFRLIHKLSETNKEVMLLRINGDFSFKEIGEVFGKSENWARVTFYRAKQKIIERMSTYES
ncbi:RNA polymerase sigma factor [Lysinibacillus sp. NPDC098008]|uniref:RNA polymerase sigma factor n=1 Tax=Lysinibacillus sp. NPDC098008 TaxID=3364146 RepID=UPI0038249E68